MSHISKKLNEKKWFHLKRRSNPIANKKSLDMKAQNDVLNPRKTWISSIQGLLKVCSPPTSSSTKSTQRVSNESNCNNGLNIKTVEKVVDDVPTGKLSTDSTDVEANHDFESFQETTSARGQNIADQHVSEQNITVSENDLHISEISKEITLVNKTPPKAVTTSLPLPPRAPRSISVSQLRSCPNSTTIDVRKPRVAKRAVTSNSTTSLHRRQQPLNGFEFDAASLARITSTSDDHESSEILLPRTIDVAMRAISVMTDFSDEDDDVMDLEHFYDSDREDSDNNKEEIPSVSPTCVVDVIAPSKSDTPAWMLQWANTNVDLKEPQPLSQDVTWTTEDSQSVGTFGYSCSDASTQAAYPVYLPSDPFPYNTSFLADDTVVFNGWVAVSFEPIWVDNDDPIINENSLYYLRICLPPKDCVDSDKLQFHISRCNEDIRMDLSPNFARVSVQHVSARMGNCIAIEDGNQQIFILPVHVSKSAVHKAKKPIITGSNNRRESFFTPFVKTSTCTEDQRLYAPDDQHDAVIHLRFVIDTAFLILSER